MFYLYIFYGYDQSSLAELAQSKSHTNDKN